MTIFTSNTREQGGIIIDGQQVGSTVQCCHCGKHWQYVPGSGNVRGFCLKCNRLHCGAKACMPCVPIEARLEHAEGKKTLYDDTIKELVAQGAVLI